MRRLFLTVATTYALFWAPTNANAGCGTDYWQGNVNQYWEIGLNWSLGAAPQPCDDVVIPDPIKGEGIYAEAGAYGPKTYWVNSLQIGVGSRGSLQIDSGSKLHTAGDLIVGGGGEIANNGSLSVNGTGTLDLDAYVAGNGRYLFQHDLYNHSKLIIPNLITVAGTLHNDAGITVPRQSMVTTVVLDNFGSISSPGPFGTMWVGSGTAQAYGYFQYANGTLVERISSLGYGTIQADKIVLGGTLNIQLAQGFNPSVGTVYQIMTCFAGGLSGGFGRVQNRYFNNGTEEWVIVRKTVLGTEYLELKAVAVQ